MARQAVQSLLAAKKKTKNPAAVALAQLAKAEKKRAAAEKKLDAGKKPKSVLSVLKKAAKAHFLAAAALDTIVQ